MEKSPYPFSPPSAHPPPPPPPQKTSLPMLYYGLVVVGTAAIVLAIYNLIIIKWCANHQRRLHNMNRSLEGTSSLGIRRRSLDNSSINLGASFKYKKEGEGEGEGLLQLGYECPVCLSVFEEEEEVRQLPRCKHFFHAPCIDMWLYSHLDCPLCRAPVELREVFPRQTSVATPSDHSREVLLIEQGILV